jgi:hypothetical protein
VSYWRALETSVDRGCVTDIRPRRDAARWTMRRQLFTSRTAPGRSTLGACTRMAHVLTEIRINKVRGMCTSTR